MKENDFLSWIAARTPPHPMVPLNIGDDMAAVRAPAGNPLALLKIDQCLDQVHFDLRSHSPTEAARKAVNRCLSDCAAMACLPAAIMLSLALPSGTGVPPVSDLTAFTQELFLAAQAAAAAFNCPLVGGDTGIWNQRLAITVAALGWSSSQLPTRAGAQPGDAICVTGALGGSILGRHLTFTPRIPEAQAIASHASIHAMMDLSDGLATDLPRLCRLSKVGATIDSRLLPVHPDVARLTTTQSPTHHALSDGEDYELLFTLSESDWKKLQAIPLPHGTPITRIGTITQPPSIILMDDHNQSQPWPQGGWEYKSE